MLRGIRNASTNWLGRIVMGVVMGLLAATFAVWGINDIFKGFGRSTLAKVGGTEIPIEQFRRTYNERLQQLSRQVGQPISPEQAKAIGLERSVLLGMVNDAGLDQRARQMGLGLSDEEIVRRITEDPTFRGPTGKFDRGRFDQFLRAVGMTEQRVVAEQRRLMLRRQIVEFDQWRRAGAESLARSGQRVSEPAAQYRIRDAGTRRKRATSRRRRRNSSASISRSAKSCSAHPNTARSKSSR